MLIMVFQSQRKRPKNMCDCIFNNMDTNLELMSDRLYYIIAIDGIFLNTPKIVSPFDITTVYVSEIYDILVNMSTMHKFEFFNFLVLDSNEAEDNISDKDHYLSYFFRNKAEDEIPVRLYIQNYEATRKIFFSCALDAIKFKYPPIECKLFNEETSYTFKLTETDGILISEFETLLNNSIKTGLKNILPEFNSFECFIKYEFLKDCYIVIYFCQMM